MTGFGIVGITCSLRNTINKNMNFIISVSKFERDVHYRELSKKQAHRKYRFMTTGDVVIEFSEPILTKEKRVLFLDGHDRIWMEMENNRLKVFSGYAWNGCSPKRWFGIWWGTPDFKKTIHASLVHDCLVQFKNCKHFPFSKEQRDNVFYQILKWNKFWLSKLYYFGVRLGTKVIPEKKYKVYSLTTPCKG